MKKRTYFQEVIPYIIKGTIGGALLIAVIIGFLESIIEIDLSTLEIFQLSFTLSFIIFNIFYLIGLQLSKYDELQSELKKLRRDFENYKLRKEIEN